MNRSAVVGGNVVSGKQNVFAINSERRVAIIVKNRAAEVVREVVCKFNRIAGNGQTAVGKNRAAAVIRRVFVENNRVGFERSSVNGKSAAVIRGLVRIKVDFLGVCTDRRSVNRAAVGVISGTGSIVVVREIERPGFERQRSVAANRAALVFGVVIVDRCNSVCA